MFFNLAIKHIATCIRYIYLKYYVIREIRVNLSFFYFIINQKRKMFMNHCPLPILPFSPKLYTCTYIQNIMCNGGLGTSRERCCREKKTKMRVMVDIIFAQKLTEVLTIDKEYLYKNLINYILVNSNLNLHREVYFK